MSEVFNPCYKCQGKCCEICAFYETAPRINDLETAIKETIAYQLCGECDQLCISFYDATPAIINSKPCPEVGKLMKLVHADFLEQDAKWKEENGG